MTNTLAHTAGNRNPARTQHLAAARFGGLYSTAIFN
jgi:hypothetical protein